MAKFLDLEGLNYFWDKIKSWVLERFAYKSEVNQKLDKLKSGQNIKTINGLDIIGPGNIEIQGGSGAVNLVNGKTGNVVLSASDVGAVPTERTINGKALSSNITLNANDVNALSSSTPIPTKVSDLNNDLNFTSVSIDRKVSSGTNIADITIDGTTTLLYAPTSGGGGGGEENLIESISVNGTAQTIDSNKNVDITVPTKVSDLNNDSGFTANVGTITSVKMNGNTISSSGEADLGTVITSHQDIDGKEDKTNKVTSFQSTPDDTHYPSEKLVKDSIDAKQDVLTFNTTPSSSNKVATVKDIPLIYIGINTNWGTDALDCNLNPSYFQGGVVPTKAGDYVYSVGNGNLHRCGTITPVSGQNYNKTTPTYVGKLNSYPGSAASGISSSNITNWNGKSDKVVNIDASTPPSTLDPNKVYLFGTLSGNTTFPAFSSITSGDTEVKIWCWIFTTPSTAPTITWPAGITGWSGGSQPTINASKSYEITVMNGLATIIES